jgi:tetraacyldisaccharide 4'-kinase
VVSDGSTVLATAAEAGDEPLLLAQNLKGLAAVVSDSHRAAAGRWAREKLGADVFVLDDGFQHLRLARDLDLLAIDATNPWGGGRLLPYGRLREARGGAARADCVVVTRADQSPNLPSLKKEIRRYNNSSPILTSTMRIRSVTKLSSSLEDEIASVPKPVAAFCAIGNPKAFFDQLGRAGCDPVFTRGFPDHHRYSQADLEFVCQKSKERGAQSLITTAKDAVKLQAHSIEMPCYVLNIEIAIEEEGQLREMIDVACRV